MTLIEKLRKYRFEFRHLIILFAILIAFQIILSLIHGASLRSYLVSTQDWYQKDSAEKLASVTSTSLELLVETINPREKLTEAQASRVTQSVNIILSQQLLGRNAKEICILVSKGDRVYAVDEGSVLVNLLANSRPEIPAPTKKHDVPIQMYRTLKGQLRAKEEVVSILEGKQTFHTFVPFVPNGEFVGAVYVKNEPDFRFITSSLTSNYNETSFIYTSLIFIGLLATFFVSSYTVRERDKARKLWYEEHEELLKEKIVHEKEYAFTKRIYHTHHKAAKVMAFVKQDLQALSPSNIEEIRFRIAKYANFVSRVIYDMKWYEPALSTIRNPMFHTDLNEVLRFLVDNLFLRLAKASSRFTFTMELDAAVPEVHVNEFVVWEIVEPLIQNSLVHAGVEHVQVTVRTAYDAPAGRTRIIITDDGKGIREDLLERDAKGIRRIFLEHVSTKQESGEHSGYGCFIAYDLARNRCGWELDAENLPAGGCQFIITIPN